MKGKVDKRNCVGCRNNFYNGNNDIGVTECWSLADAKMVTKYRIGWWQSMGDKSNFVKVRVPNCYHQPGTNAFLDSIPRSAK